MLIRLSNINNMSSGKKIQATGDYTKNKVQLVKSGKPYFDLIITLIQKATESIHIQSYILADDDTGIHVTNALKIAVQRDVSVYILADGYASRSLSTKFIDGLKLANIKFRFFEPLYQSKYFYFGRRMHQKLMVVDAKYALVGGINIADRYNDLPGCAAWLDYAVYIEGPIAKELCVHAWKSWNDFPEKMGITPCEEKEIHFSYTENETVLARIRRNDWVRRKNDISYTYVNMLRNANSHITIMCSYFLPGRLLRKLLRLASARGVKIKVIVAGKSDVKLAKAAERWMYDWLLRYKIELYEYQPNILHAKVVVSDGKLCSIGSYNINDISAYASIELNIDVLDELFSKNVEQTLEGIIKNDCTLISKEKHLQTKNIFKQFYRWCSYKIFRIGFNMVTFYFKRKE